MIRNCLLVLLLTLFMTMKCTKKIEQPFSTLINTQHLDHLYEQITINGAEMGIIHIYSNYPDYKWVDASAEGIACVDDIARAALFYLEQYQKTNKTEYWQKVKNLINFLRYMQADNGWFYNFIDTEYGINKIHKNSVALPTWWTWRALWAISEAVLFRAENDSAYSKLWQSCLAKPVHSLLLQKPDITKLKIKAGFDLPTWLPYETGADQTAVLLLFLVNYYQIKKDRQLLSYIGDLCSGIMLMQQGDEQNFPHFAFLSWENNWHGWGNMQSYALLRAYLVTHDQNLLTAALREIDHFYAYIYHHQYLADFAVQKEGNKIKILSNQQFPQIAYTITPMVWACLQAGIITGNIRYDEQAAELAGWFFGYNPAQKKMYDPSTGRCFDGIESMDKINENSGAESTIEALLALSRIEQNSVARKHLSGYIKTRID